MFESHAFEISWQGNVDDHVPRENSGAIIGPNPEAVRLLLRRGPARHCKLRSIGKRAEEYGGFLGTAVYRPLVATSQPFSGDPQNWKFARLPPSLISDVRQAFRRKFPRATNCRNADENIARPWKYSDENIRVARAHSSRDHWFLAQTLLTPYRCDGPPDGGFVDQWFSIAPSGEIKFLDKAMWFVDAGDYGNDGKSEVVFSLAGYDKGGYELFYDDFMKHATFEFSYH